MPALAHRYHGLRGDPLIAETYRRYPYYAIRSDTAERMLEDDGVALRRIRDARPRRAPARLSTIGYEGRTLEGYLNKLLRSSVTLLCDVRRNAFSRKYGFSKTTLAGACDGVGIRYEHLPEHAMGSVFATNICRSLESNRDSAEISKPRRISTLCSRCTSGEFYRGGAMLWKKFALGCNQGSLSPSLVTSVRPANAIDTV